MSAWEFRFFLPGASDGLLDAAKLAVLTVASEHDHKQREFDRSPECRTDVYYCVDAMRGLKTRGGAGEDESTSGEREAEEVLELKVSTVLRFTTKRLMIVIARAFESSLLLITSEGIAQIVRLR